MSDYLPELDKKSAGKALPYVKGIFRDHFTELIPYSDGHFRVIFRAAYFNLGSDRPVPTKSQWSSLKKKMKRHHKGVFIFKETGPVSDQPERYYVDFGFFLY